MTLEAEPKMPFASFAAGCGGGGMLGRGRGLGAGLEGRGRDPEWWKECWLECGPSWCGLSGGVGVLGGEGSDSPCAWWAGGGWGGGWLGAWIGLSLMVWRLGVMGGWWVELDVCVLLGWESKGLNCFGGAGACFLVPSDENTIIIWYELHWW